jgi:regulator of CtrA degradation
MPKAWRLVEETANYLDGPGRVASKALPRLAGVLYAAESMRLTTRLMQMASWLLLQRAVNNGEMNRDQVLAEKNKVRLDSFNCDRNAPGWADLPESFRDLVERSLRIQNRVAILDREIYRPANEAAALKPDNENSVQAQQHLLQTVFSQALKQKSASRLCRELGPTDKEARGTSRAFSCEVHLRLAGPGTPQATKSPPEPAGF